MPHDLLILHIGSRLSGTDAEGNASWDEGITMRKILKKLPVAIYIGQDAQSTELQKGSAALAVSRL